MPFNDHAIYRHLFAGAHKNNIPGHNFGNGDVNFLPVPHDAGRFCL